MDLLQRDPLDLLEVLVLKEPQVLLDPQELREILDVKELQVMI